MVSECVLLWYATLWLILDQLFNFQFLSPCTLLQQTICHALTEYVLMFSHLLNVQCMRDPPFDSRLVI